MEKNEILVFDFDGTLANTTKAILKIYEKVAQRFSLNSLTEKEILELRNNRPQEILKKIGLMGLNVIKLPWIVRYGRSELAKEITEFKPVTGIREVLVELSSLGFKMGIITSNSKDNVLKFLKINDLEYFDFVFSTFSLNKSHLINSFLKSHKLLPSQIVFITDEIRDIQAAHKNGVKVMAVAWGFNSKDSLEAENPEQVFDQPAELKRFIESHY